MVTTAFVPTRVRSVPTPPAGVALVIRAANDPGVSLADLAHLIEREPSLTVNLLRLSNSAAFSMGREIRTVGQATVLLGSRVIRNISVAHAVTALRRVTDVGGFDVGAFWSDSLRRACAALVLARVAGYEDPSEAFTVGLIQDLGVLVFAMSGHGDAVQAMRTATSHERMRQEIAMAGRSHGDEFVALARGWGLPPDLIDAVATHHDIAPSSHGDRRSHRLSEIARVADLIADISQTRATGDALSRAHAALDRMSSRQPLVLHSIVDLVAAEMHVQSQDLDIRIERQPTWFQLIEGANQALLRISISYEEMTQRLELLLVEKEDLATKLAASNAALQRLATTDPLTNVGNRRSFAESLQKAIAEVGTGRPASLLVLDLDHFKSINDAYGHAVGDDVLVGVAQRLAAHVRSGDTVGRLGGEEFGILLAGCGEADSVLAGARLCACLRSAPIMCRDGTYIPITGSFGGVVLSPGVASDDALREADEAMYRAKEAGRDRVSWARTLSRSPLAALSAWPRTMAAIGRASTDQEHPSSEPARLLLSR